MGHAERAPDRDASSSSHRHLRFIACWPTEPVSLAAIGRSLVPATLADQRSRVIWHAITGV
jgi:hypothetical protein